MQILVINLASATNRHGFQKAQLAALGLAFERVEATDANAAELDAEAPIWNTWERPMSRSERACFLSHKRLWQRIAHETSPSLVLEDDVLLSSNLPKLLDALNTVTDVDYVTLETRARKKLLGRLPADAIPIRRLYQDRSGAAAYVLWPSGARKLLSRTQNTVGLTDAVLCSAYELSAFQADPPLAIQADISEMEKVQSPLETQSSVIRVSSDRLSRGAVFHFRRLRNQSAIAFRRLRYMLTGSREMLHVKPEDFQYLQTISSTMIAPQSRVNY